MTKPTACSRDFAMDVASGAAPSRRDGSERDAHWTRIVRVIQDIGGPRHLGGVAIFVSPESHRLLTSEPRHMLQIERIMSIHAPVGAQISVKDASSVAENSGIVRQCTSLRRGIRGSIGIGVRIRMQCKDVASAILAVEDHQVLDGLLALSEHVDDVLR